MQLILSDTDFEKMPPELRQGLLRYLAGEPRPKPSTEPQATPLSRTQATALLREASFHADGKVLHVLLKRLAYGEESEAPQRRRLAEALPSAARRHLARHLATLNRLTARAAKQRGAKLWLYRRAADAYAVHPATRQALRDLIPVLARSGKAEEPLWES